MGYLQIAILAATLAAGVGLGYTYEHSQVLLMEGRIKDQKIEAAGILANETLKVREKQILIWINHVKHLYLPLTLIILSNQPLLTACSSQTVGRVVVAPQVKVQVPQSIQQMKPSLLGYQKNFSNILQENQNELKEMGLIKIPS
jgi:hypothetical protein